MASNATYKCKKTKRGNTVVLFSRSISREIASKIYNSKEEMYSQSSIIGLSCSKDTLSIFRFITLALFYLSFAKNMNDRS